ncbi:cobyrinate a,c-diamide synthase [Tessaracoccus sp. MC1679]|uniref:cobyrinate a,c-diamide synthase n=1 Tax=Tessaracoccus sp. MC1679 TaxID=2760313 RepID=UPI002104BBC4|nr:cobyrinate a,c-diamide synthase [Tessaracoccus sp. MC1679]
MVSRLVIAAPSSGQGKTTVATGLMAALRARGLEVAPFKVGPDYIDPGYHGLATGRPGRNLDPFLCGEARMGPLFAHGAVGADVAVIEGVMGLFDGRLGTGGFGSTAHVARLLDAPVVLVIDARHTSRSVGAVALGMARFDPRVRVAGVILNQVGSDRHAAEARAAVEEVGLPVLGVLPKALDIEAPSRHLGLVPVAERDDSRVAAMGEVVAEHVDVEALLAVAVGAPELDVAPWDPAREVSPPSDRRPVVAVAGGRAFTFRYPETDELLEAAGCRVVEFDPLVDSALPEGTAGLWLGGGFPEVYAGELASNSPLTGEIRAAVAGGLPTVAECAGLLYLCRSLDGRGMVGAVEADATMGPRLTMGYRVAVSSRDTLLGRPDEEVTGHEFHRTTVSLDAAAGETAAVGPAWLLDGRDDGVAGETLHASYLHVHWAGHPQLAQRFADAAHAQERVEAAVSLRSLRRSAREAAGTVSKGREPKPAWGPGSQPFETPEAPSAPGLLRERVGAPEVPSVPGLLRERVGAPEVPSVPGLLRERGETAELDDPEAGSTHARGQRSSRSDPDPLRGPRPCLEEQQPRTPDPTRLVPGTVDLLHHGDRDLAPGLVDLAVNVRVPATPTWLAEEIFGDGDLAAYPDPRPARDAIAAHHGVDPAIVLPVAGAAEAFTLIARALPGDALVVHPQFTEPEAALRAAGRDPRRHLLRPDTGFRLVPSQVPAADLIIVGNPTNPTGVLHLAADLAALPAGILVVDEAFMDAIPGETETLIAPTMPGRLVLRSLTKTWGLAGLRVGYVIGDPALIALLAAQQPPWSVSTPAIRASVACTSPRASAEASRLAEEAARARADLAARLTDAGLAVVHGHAPFVLADASALSPMSLREPLAERGFAVRRGETFPGLGPTWLRFAVRTPDVHRRLAAAFSDLNGWP